MANFAHSVNHHRAFLDYRFPLAFRTERLRNAICEQWCEDASGEVGRTTSDDLIDQIVTGLQVAQTRLKQGDTEDAYRIIGETVVPAVRLAEKVGRA